MDFDFRPYKPQRALQPFVHQIFYAKGRIPYKFDKILPNGNIVLIINFGNPHKIGKDPDVDNNPICTNSWLDGLQTSPIYNYPLDGTFVAGCLFDPLGFYQLTGINMVDWADRSDVAGKIFGEKEINLLRLELLRAGNAQNIFHVFENWLLHKLPCRYSAADWLIKGYQTIQSGNGNIVLEKLYNDSNVSGRHFNNQFRKVTGLSPKVFCRVLRLVALLSEIDPQGKELLTQLAYDHGFTDQAHFNREFRKFSGLTPKQYIRQRRREYGNLEKGENAVFIPIP